jgi:hypothetical protein
VIFTAFGPQKMLYIDVTSDEEVKEAVHDWLAQQPKYFFS